MTAPDPSRPVYWVCVHQPYSKPWIPLQARTFADAMLEGLTLARTKRPNRVTLHDAFDPETRPLHTWNTVP